MATLYLDHAATTPLDPDVLAAMLPYLKTHYGNASSVHSLGRKARHAVEESRNQVAEVLCCEPGEILFTSGGTEADNLALRGALPAGRRLLTSPAEHEAVLETAKALEKSGAPVTYLPVAEGGRVTAAAVQDALTSDAGLVSLMYVNNETGACTAVAQVAEVCRAQGVLFHTDAVQAAGSYALEPELLGVDLMTLSGHKINGPKGVGVLYVRGGVDLTPQASGGSQERRRRGGTENVAGIVGFGVALRKAEAHRTERAAYLRALRDRLYEGLRAALGEAFLCNTPLLPTAAAPHILNIAFPARLEAPVDGEMLLLNLDLEGICVSSGSACTSGTLQPSHVLLALGLPAETASAAVRFSLGHHTTAADIDQAVAVTKRVWSRMKMLA